MLTCLELTELANDYLEEETPWWASVQVKFHLWMCEHCREYVHQLKHTVELTRSVPAKTLSPQDHQQLRSVFEQWKSENRGP